jgi:iron(III) transport system ATP-binding protein
MLEISKLTKFFGKVKVLDGVSCTFSGSQVVLGPSGSGKSTLLRLIAGLENPDGGEIRLDNTLISCKGWSLPPHLRNIGFVFQTPSLWPHMTVAQNILFGLGKLRKAEARRRLEELLEQTELSSLAHRYPDQISGGEARRVALARALAPRPRYLLMDEPLTNLDQEIKSKLLNYINRTVKQETACLIYVTHDLREAEQISEYILHLKKGQIQDGIQTNEINR